MRKYFRLVLIMCAVLTGVSCSSDSINPDDSDIPLGTPGGGGGIGGSGLSIGTLTGIGSVYINGNRFDTSGSEFTVNGQTGNQSQLRVGMQLTAEVNFSTSAAQNVNYTASVIGPIETPPNAAGRILVLNQAVNINAATILDAITLPDLITGQEIEVSGWKDANENLIASYIRRANSNQYQLTGSITSVTPDRQSVTVAAVTVRIDQADLGGLGNQSLQAGLPIIVTAPASQYDSSTATLIASTITPLGVISAPTDTRIEISGFVTAYDSANSFNVDGIPITTDNNTVYEFVDGRSLGPASVSLNSLVEIEGLFSANGTVRAGRIVIIPAENSKLEGRIESIDSASKSLVMFGIPINTTALTRFSGDGNESTMNFAALRAGDSVEVDAAFTASDVVATKIEIEDPEDESILEGPVTEVNANAGTLKIIGISIAFDADSEFNIGSDNIEQQVDQQTFLNQVSVGTIVKVKWKEFSSITMPVEEIELE